MPHSPPVFCDPIQYRHQYPILDRLAIALLISQILPLGPSLEHLFPLTRPRMQHRMGGYLVVLRRYLQY